MKSKFVVVSLVLVAIVFFAVSSGWIQADVQTEVRKITNFSTSDFGTSEPSSFGDRARTICGGTRNRWVC